jgi:hypothetical protein
MLKKIALELCCIYARKVLIFTSASASASRASNGLVLGMQWMPSQERHLYVGSSVAGTSRLWRTLFSLLVWVRGVGEEMEKGGVG